MQSARYLLKERKEKMTYNEFLDQVKKFEGFVDHTYTDVGGVKTIGYGFTNTVYTNKLTMTRKEADEILDKLVKKTMENVKNYMIEKGYIISQDWLYALTDFTYNCGMANLKLLTNNGKRTLTEIHSKILEYNKCNKKVLKGLTIRRQWEHSLMSGLYTSFDVQMLCNTIIEEFELNIEKLVIDGKLGEKSINTIGKLLSLMR